MHAMHTLPAMACELALFGVHAHMQFKAVACLGCTRRCNVRQFAAASMPEH